MLTINYIFRIHDKNTYSLKGRNAQNAFQLSPTKK